MRSGAGPIIAGVDREAAEQAADDTLVGTAAGDEFDRKRLLALCDGVFAFALTLLVLSFSVPVLKSTASNEALAEALLDRSSELVSWLISFAVIGLFWVAHSAFMRHVVRINRAFLGATFAFLALIAFIPYPTELVGRFGNATSVAFYALVVALLILANALVSEVALTQGLTDEEETPAERSRRRFDSMVPAAFFLLSIPVAFLVGPTWAYACWVAQVPFERVVTRMWASKERAGRGSEGEKPG